MWYILPNASTLLDASQEEHSACKKLSNDEVFVWSKWQMIYLWSCVIFSLICI